MSDDQYGPRATAEAILAGGRAALVAAAKNRMMDIARQAVQQSTRKQDFAARVERQKQRRRGGAPGDVMPPGQHKRKEPESALSTQPPRQKQRLYGPRTEVFDIGREPIRAW